MNDVRCMGIVSSSHPRLGKHAVTDLSQIIGFSGHLLLVHNF